MFLTRIFILLLFVCCSFWQKGNAQKQHMVDSNYIKVLPNHISITPSIFRKDNVFNIKEKGAPRLSYSINSRLKLGLHVAWRWISFGFSINVPNASNEDKYGKTQTLDFRTNFLIKNKVLVDLQFATTKGMYLSNAENHIPEFSETVSTYPHYPNMRTFQFGLDVNYLFNSRQYSYKAAFGQNVVQLKTAGGFGVGGYFYLMSVNNDGVLYPEESEHNFNRLKGLNGVNVISYGPEFGYAQNIVFKKHGLVGLLGLLGLGVSSFEEKALDGSSLRHTNFGSRFKFKGMIGYQGDMHSAGFSFRFHATATSYAKKIKGSTILGYTGVYYKIQFTTKKYRGK